MQTVTHPKIPNATCTLTPFTELTKLPLWSESGEKLEGQYPEEAYVYKYTGPNAPPVYTQSYVVRYDGSWWLYFDTSLAYKEDSKEEVAQAVAEQDWEDLS